MSNDLACFLINSVFLHAIVGLCLSFCSFSNLPTIPDLRTNVHYQHYSRDDNVDSFLASCRICGELEPKSAVDDAECDQKSTIPHMCVGVDGPDTRSDELPVLEEAKDWLNKKKGNNYGAKYLMRPFPQLCGVRFIEAVNERETVPIHPTNLAKRLMRMPQVEYRC
jgi:hypothetical protein